MDARHLSLLLCSGAEFLSIIAGSDGGGAAVELGQALVETCEIFQQSSVIVSHNHLYVDPS